MNDWLKIFTIFFILASLVYFNSLNNKFLIDDHVFLNNPVMNGKKFILSQFNPYREQALGVVDSGQNLGYYRPLTHIVYDLCYGAFKDHYWKYHLLNLFLFVFASSLIYVFIKNITGDQGLAFLTGLFYLVHPINGIMVNYISASVFSFQVIFTLAALLFLFRSLEGGNDRVPYYLSLLFCFLSLFWHENGVMVPFYVSAFVLIFRRDPLKNKVSCLIPYFLIIFSYLAFRSLLIRKNVSISDQASVFHWAGGQYLASLFQIIYWYISKLFYPYGIVMQWSSFILKEHIFLYVLGFFLLVLVFILLFIRLTLNKICQLAVAWFLIGLIPVCLQASILSANGPHIEPHWFVFSSVGFFILTAYVFLNFYKRRKRYGTALIFILVFLWGSISHAYNQLWVDQKTYALYWSQQAPGLRSTYYYLASAYTDEGNYKRSLKYLKMSLSGRPSDADIYICIGIIDSIEGRFKEAELNYKKALTINPRSSYAFSNLGDLYLKQGQWQKANDFYRLALVNNPLLLGSRRGLATIFLEQRQYRKAIDQCLINLGYVSDDQDTLLLLIDIYIRTKDFVSVRKYTHQVIDDGSDPKVLTRLGVLMAQHNVFDLALDCFIKAIHIDPENKDAYLLSGAVLANLGKFDEAIHVWKAGSSLDPYDQRFKVDIAKAIKLRGSL